MSNPSVLIKVALLSCFLFIVLTVGDFAMMNDIHYSYVSQSAFKDLGITLQGTLPKWTNTKGEWNSLYWSHVLKLLVSGLVLVSLSRYARTITQNTIQFSRADFWIEKSTWGAVAGALLSSIFFSYSTKMLFYGTSAGLIAGLMFGLVYGITAYKNQEAN